MAGNGTHTINIGDGSRLFVKNWSRGRPVVFSHGRLDQLWTGNDMDHYTDNLAAVIGGSHDSDMPSTVRMKAPRTLLVHVI